MQALVHRCTALVARTTAVLGIAMLVGCAAFEPQPGPGVDPPGRYVDLTLPITALGDTQEHESTGVPLHDNDSAIDAYVEVTQRPPEQPLFGRRLTEFALQSHRGEPWLHLGDVMDLSCRSEAERMRKIFGAAGRQGAILPGNHDGLMFGIYRYDAASIARDPGATKWNEACRRGTAEEGAGQGPSSQVFTKRDLITLYLAEHAVRQDDAPGLAAPPAAGEHRISWRNPNSEAFLTAVEARVVEGTGYADSFLAQRLRLPRAQGATRDVVLIGLDTNQSGPLVSAWDTIRGRSPGSMGHVRPEQVAAISTWVAHAARQGDIVVFAGHHNWRSLGLPSRVMLRDLMNNLDHPLVYLSAHTHRGFWAVHRTLASQPLLELNVSSLSDWPLAWRRISFAYDESSNRLLVRADLLPRGPAPHASDDDLLAAWQSQTCDASGFSSDYLRAVDFAEVTRQRESRRSLFEWLEEEFSADCPPCEQSRYEHANAYQDQMLATLLQIRLHMGPDAAGLPAARLPAWCAGKSYFNCINDLLAETPRDAAGQRALFRRKAQIVDRIGSQLDDIVEPRAKAYMTCRAVLATKVDFDATPDDRNSDRGVAKRRAEQFFRVEASVGME